MKSSVSVVYCVTAVKERGEFVPGVPLRRIIANKTIDVYKIVNDMHFMSEVDRYVQSHHCQLHHLVANFVTGSCSYCTTVFDEKKV